jgi:CDP-diacylglycerol--inositol 3-phosphatidyltransferase
MHTKSPVFFIPNILDYVRIILLIAVIFLFATHTYYAIALYALNSILDGLDGTLARLLNQQSKLGALLDFSIDRAAITILLGACIWASPHLFVLFLFVMALDIGSHFAVCYASAYNNGSHLKFLTKGSPLLCWFSQKSWVRYSICTSHDLFFGLFIINTFIPSSYWIILWIILSPGMLLKTWIHLEQFYLAAKFTALN